MQLPGDLHLCVPNEGLITAFVCGMYQNNERMSPVVSLGAAIPFLQYELNVRGFLVDTGGGQVLPPSILSLIVAPSGVGKSTTWRRLLEIRKLATGREIHEGQIGLDASTTAGVADEIIARYDEQENLSPGLFFADEFGRTLGAVKERGGKAKDLPQFLNSILMGASVQTALARRPGESRPNSRTVRNPRVSGCGFTVHSLLQRGNLIDEDMATNGFLARLLVLHVPEDQASFSAFPWDRTPFDPKSWKFCVSQYKAWLNSLDRWAGQDKRVFHVTEDAQATLRTLHEHCQQEFGGTSEAIRSCLNRAMDKASFVGALYASLRGSREVTADDVAPAINVVMEGLAAIHRLDGDGIGTGDLSDAEQSLARRRDNAVRILGECGIKGCAPSSFYIRHRKKMGSHVGVVAETQKHLDEVLSTLLEPGEDGESLITYIAPGEYRAYQKKQGHKVMGRPCARYFLTEELPLPLRSRHQQGVSEEMREAFARKALNPND